MQRPRLVIINLTNLVIRAAILERKFQGEEVLIPRIPLIPTDMPLEFKRVQFPFCLAFAMTRNKSQGQTFGISGSNLENEYFSNGQLYVANSQVRQPSALFELAPHNQTKNIRRYFDDNNRSSAFFL